MFKSLKVVKLSSFKDGDSTNGKVSEELSLQTFRLSLKTG